MQLRYRLAIFASGSGTNAEEIFKYFHRHPSIQVGLVLSNNPEAFVLRRATQHGIPSMVFDRTEFREGNVILQQLKHQGITHLVLAGFLWLVPPYLIESFPHRIINIHPALLPKFGGKGMYGMRVHEAVKLAGEKETGITIHSIDEKYDEGDILFQASCAVNPTDTPEDIRKKVQALEYQHYPTVIEKWVLEKPIS
jgi:phosphoribosylglycinamide formyltransferase-1